MGRVVIAEDSGLPLMHCMRWESDHHKIHQGDDGVTGGVLLLPTITVLECNVRTVRPADVLHQLYMRVDFVTDCIYSMVRSSSLPSFCLSFLLDVLYQYLFPTRLLFWRCALVVGLGKLYLLFAEYILLGVFVSGVYLSFPPAPSDRSSVVANTLWSWIVPGLFPVGLLFG
ncbi:hypothetical protein Tco_1004389 [Tanacetum coccineum]|uniref:Uncharacterized protein n=1 Tax=Tanacetum coccineum TaxID=301880 RepID=A0ABQ5FBS0_9ASTR